MTREQHLLAVVKSRSVDALVLVAADLALVESTLGATRPVGRRVPELAAPGWPPR